MTRRPGLLWILGAALWASACGGTAMGTDAAPDTAMADTVMVDASTDTTTLDAALDVPATDTAMDAPADRVSMDAPTDTPADRALGDTVADSPADSSSADAAGLCAPGTSCHPYFCGCGRCDPALITCISDSRTCPLGCPIACPELDTTMCTCTDGHCVRSSTTTDAGADAATDAGLAAGEPCDTAAQCAVGLLCCYPCGIPGCHNVCEAPGADGMCPLRP